MSQGLATRDVVMVGFERFQMLDVTGPLEVFALASRVLQARSGESAPPYRVRFLARAPGPVRSSSGLELTAAGLPASTDGIDTLLVAGGVGVDSARRDSVLVDWLARNVGKANRYGAVCTGALLLAEAGLLDQRRVTTHWASMAQLAHSAPAARIAEDAVFVSDGRLWTSAGVTAGMDMALAMVAADWGRGLALEVARQLVMYISRAGGSSQLGSPLETQALAGSGRFRDLAAWVQERLGSDLSIDVLAEKHGMSPRHFARCFREEMGMTPAKFVERARLDAARQLLATSRESLETIARSCGFGCAETLRRVFLRNVGIGPSLYRRRALGEQGAAAPEL